MRGYIRRDSYDIPYRMEKGSGDKVVIVAHGFASSKESPTVEMLAKELPEKGIGVAALDFPAHGESPVDGEFLTVKNCVRDLGDVEAFIREECPGAEICCFGSSFGAYITLIYLMESGKEGARAFLRSAAVNMSDYFSELTKDERRAIDEMGYFLLEDEVRPIKITRGLVESLKANDIREDFRPDGLRLMMIHGSADEDIDYSEARAFAEKYDVPLITVEGGDHRLSIPGAPEKVLEEALRFFG